MSASVQRTAREYVQNAVAQVQDEIPALVQCATTDYAQNALAQFREEIPALVQGATTDYAQNALAQVQNEIPALVQSATAQYMQSAIVDFQDGIPALVQGMVDVSVLSAVQGAMEDERAASDAPSKESLLRLESKLDMSVRTALSNESKSVQQRLALFETRLSQAECSAPSIEQLTLALQDTDQSFRVLTQVEVLRSKLEEEKAARALAEATLSSKLSKLAESIPWTPQSFNYSPASQVLATGSEINWKSAPRLAQETM